MLFLSISFKLTPPQGDHRCIESLDPLDDEPSLCNHPNQVLPLCFVQVGWGTGRIKRKFPDYLLGKGCYKTCLLEDG